MSTTLESFVNVLKRSGLVDEPVLSKSLDSLRDLEGTQTAEMLADSLIHKDVITSWQATKLLQGKHKGFFLGKYRLLSLLGKGGMSSVYLAEHVLMRRRCAIKVLPWKLVKDSSYLQRFHREAQAVASLDHPNIVRAYDIDHEKDGNLEIHFLVMEYVEGRNLYDLVQQMGPLSAVTAADYIRQGALGLAHAHQAGMVHRDVKPGNFLVDQHGTVKLMDLGLARVSAQEGDHSLTIANDERVLGTADYLAPEQAVDSHLVDTRADLYSLGCTLYFLLAGRPPFNEGTLTQRLLAHQTKEPTAIEKLRPDLPESLIPILRKLMMKDREQRYQTADEVADEFTHWLKTQDGTGTAPELPPLSSDESLETLEPASEIRTGGEGSQLTRDLTPEDSTKKVPAEPVASGGEIGDFLSSLSDVTPDRQAAKQSSSKLRKKTGGSSPRIKPDSSSKIAPPKGSGRLRNVPARMATPVIEPGISKPARDSGFPRRMETRTTSNSDRNLKPSESGPAKTVPQPAPLKKSWLPAEFSDVVQQHKTAVFAGGGFLVLLVVAAVILGLRNPPKKSAVDHATAVVDKKTEKPPAPPARPPVEGTTVTVGPKGNFESIHEAIEYVRQNAYSGATNEIKVIQLEAGQTFREAISIDNSGLGTFPRGIRITGSAEKPPRLTSGGKDFVIALNSVDGIHLENIIIDCQGTAGAIQLQGYMAGAKFLRLKFENLEKKAVEGRGFSGLQDQPVVIENCIFHGKAAAAEGIRLDATSGLDSRDIAIRHCRFLGPLAAGVAIENGADSIVFQQNIFEQNRSGVLLSGSDAVRQHLVFINNTFHQCNHGIEFQTGPGENTSKFIFQQNLFVGGKEAPVSIAQSGAKIAQLTKGGRTPQFNWTDRAEVNSTNELNIFQSKGKVGSAVEFVSEDPASPDFLKPTSQALKTAAADSNEPLKFIGAVSP